MDLAKRFEHLDIIKVLVVSSSKQIASDSTYAALASYQLTIYESKDWGVRRSWSFEPSFVAIDAIFFQNTEEFVVISSNTVRVYSLGSTDNTYTSSTLWPKPVASLTKIFEDGEFFLLSSDQKLTSTAVRNGKILLPSETKASKSDSSSGCKTMFHAYNSESNCLVTIDKVSGGTKKSEIFAAKFWGAETLPRMKLESGAHSVVLSTPGKHYQFERDTEILKLISCRSGCSFFVLARHSASINLWKFNTLGEILYIQELKSITSAVNLDLLSISEHILFLLNPATLRLYQINQHNGAVVEEIPLQSQQVSRDSTFRMFVDASLVGCLIMEKGQHNGSVGCTISRIHAANQKKQSTLLASLSGQSAQPFSETKEPSSKVEVPQEVEDNLLFFYRKVLQDEFLPFQSKSNNSSVGKTHKAKPYYLSLSRPFIHAFLSGVVAAHHSNKGSELKAEEWELLKACIRSGAVNCQRYEPILALVIQHQRVDIICEIIQFVTDLSEFQALSLLYFTFQLSRQELSQYVVIGRTVTQKNKYVESLLQRAFQLSTGKRDTATTASTEGSSPLSEDAFFTKVGYNSTSSFLTELVAVQIFVELFLSRPVFYSSTMISEKVNLALPNTFAISVLIRVLTMLLKGQLPASDVSNAQKRARTGTHASYFPDFSRNQLGNLMTLLEGIIDGAFLNFVLQLQTSHQSEKNELLKAMAPLVLLFRDLDGSLSELFEFRSKLSTFQRLAASSSKPPPDSSMLPSEPYRKRALDFYSEESLLIQR